MVVEVWKVSKKLSLLYTHFIIIIFFFFFFKKKSQYIQWQSRAYGVPLERFYFPSLIM